MTVEPPYSSPPVFGLNTLLPASANTCACLDLLAIQSLFATHHDCLTEAQRDALTNMAVRLCEQLDVPFDPAMLEPDETDKNSILRELEI